MRGISRGPWFLITLTILTNDCGVQGNEWPAKGEALGAIVVIREASQNDWTWTISDNGTDVEERSKARSDNAYAKC